MTAQEAKEAIEEIKAQGDEDEDIIAVFYQMFIDDKLTLEDFEELLNIMGYELTEEFLKMSLEDQKTKGWEEEEREAKEGVSEEEIEKARGEVAKDKEEEERKAARKLFGFDDNDK